MPRRQVSILIPGKPYPQPRPSLRVIPKMTEKGLKHIPIAYDPKAAKAWKKATADIMRAFVSEPWECPVNFQVYAIWALAKKPGASIPSRDQKQQVAIAGMG